MKVQSANAFLHETQKASTHGLPGELTRLRSERSGPKGTSKSVGAFSLKEVGAEEGVITFYSAHRCGSPPDFHPDGDDNTDFDSITSAPSLAAKLSLGKHFKSNGPTATSLAHTLLQNSLTGAGSDPMRMDAKALTEALDSFVPDGARVQRNVRRVLLSRQRVEDDAMNHLFQGQLQAARDDGHYAEAIEATGEEVSQRFRELAMARYTNAMKKSADGRKFKIPKWDESHAKLPIFPNEDEEGQPIM